MKEVEREGVKETTEAKEKGGGLCRHTKAIGKGSLHHEGTGHF